MIARTRTSEAVAVLLLLAVATMLTGCRHYCGDDLTVAAQTLRIDVCDGACCARLHADPEGPPAPCRCSDACPCHRGVTYR